MIPKSRIIYGDVRETIKTISDKSINTAVTSPPYYGLRDYGTGKWEGGDPLCPHIRIAGPSKTTTLNSPGSVKKSQTLQYDKICKKCGATRADDNQIGTEELPEKYVETLVNLFREIKRILKDDGTFWLNIADSYASGSSRVNKNIKAKDLIGIPWMLAFALRNDGWYLRSDIIWAKPNGLPESIKDRPTRSHEYIFLLTKKAHYYYDYDAIKEKTLSGDGLEFKNKRDVWSVPTSTNTEGHIAAFPEKLIEPCILAGCPVDGTVFDPFSGSGTTGIVANKNERHYIGCELNQEYVKLSNRQIKAKKVITLFD